MPMGDDTLGTPVLLKVYIPNLPIALPGGNVVGPVVSTPGHLATFVDAAGKVIQDGGAAPTGSNTGDQTLASLGLDADLATLALPADTTITAAGAELVNDADAAAQRATLGAAAAADVALNTLLALAVARHGALTNLITNGDFETNVDGWTGADATLSRETAAPLIGTGSLKILLTANAGYAYMGISVISGHQYMVSCRAKSTAGAGSLSRLMEGTNYTVGASVDCSSVATLTILFTATATTTNLIGQFAGGLAGESLLLDSVVCYDLSV